MVPAGTPTNSVPYPLITLFLHLRLRPVMRPCPRYSGHNTTVSSPCHLSARTQNSDARISTADTSTKYQRRHRPDLSRPVCSPLLFISPAADTKNHSWQFAIHWLVIDNRGAIFFFASRKLLFPIQRLRRVKLTVRLLRRAA